MADVYLSAAAWSLPSLRIQRGGSEDQYPTEVQMMALRPTGR